ncbi:glycine cleavage system aminomethyltransferase GcvT [Gulosibacter macacae]|uniref:Aminomethyltransferase n=1 Tax=Gulosibacter macacae TaxID=2488791 RepID=A0A3P3VUM3_9MICO|nr:glycine cleavage system aminomethyltransferase GcvT [Gulosibacter macacae]RRJ86501.1 glycine cleavage system aminomethyltransferase GcvT [Gulosibacter macacae]
MTEPKRTALYDEHAQLGANFTEFGGWEMPLRYSRELAEHQAVREAAGLFDLSHMGEIRVTGPDAARFLNSALAGNLAAIAVGRAKYSLLTNETGGIIDDLITYRLGDEEFVVVPNAGNAEVVSATLAERAPGFNVVLEDESLTTGLIAVQGPKSVEILRGLMPEAQQALVDELKFYSAADATVAGVEVLLARTGYTGEDGFELYAANDDLPALWRALLEAGEPHGLIPAGLACRDSLRMEAGMPLYGNELGLDISPFEAGLGGVVSFKKEESFVGREALETAKDAPRTRVLVGLRGQGRRAGRAGYTVHVPGGAEIGRITSGQPSPTLGYPIAMAQIDPAYAEIGTTVEVDLRGKREPFDVVELPFYQRAK